VARKSLVRQTMHYFARPHAAVRRTPLVGPAAWRGDDLRDRDDWRYRLTATQIAEIDRALERTARHPLEALERDDFPLPSLALPLASFREELASGRGFLVISGVPVERWSQAESERFFWCLGLHLGVPGAQDPEGSLLGHVRDEGLALADPSVRRYRTRENIAFHCDTADVVGLLCLRKARTGGLSRIVSSVAIYNELLRRAPHRVERLYEPFLLDTHGQGGIRAIPVPPCRYADGVLRTFYHSDYFRSIERHPDLPQLGPDDRALLDLYEEIASDPALHLDMDLMPGEVQLLSNHVVLHARTGYEDDPNGPGRHLLRLWLSLPGPQPLRLRALTRLSWLSFVGRLVIERAKRLRAA
jgi:hypothetical protein